MPTRFISAGLTHAGHVRGYNEDAFLDAPAQRLWAVADGMGGHAAGDFASQLVVSRLAALTAVDSITEYVNQVEKTLWTVNEDLWREAQTRKVAMIGTTVVVLIAHPDFMVCGWAGDSRIYRHQSGQLQRISHDHSSVQEMQDAGQLTAEAARTHPQASAITRAVGGEQRLCLDWKIATAVAGAQFLLCSDGVTKELEDGQIASLLDAAQSPAQSTETIVRAALDRGGRDNTTAVVLRVES